MCTQLFARIVPRSLCLQQFFPKLDVIVLPDAFNQFVPDFLAFPGAICGDKKLGAYLAQPIFKGLLLLIDIGMVSRTYLEFEVLGIGSGVL